MKSDLLLAEGLLRIEETDGTCPVTVRGPTDYDIYLRENQMVGKLIPYKTEEVTSEVFITTIAESLQKAQCSDAELLRVPSGGKEKPLRINKCNS